MSTSPEINQSESNALISVKIHNIEEKLNTLDRDYKKLRDDSNNMFRMIRLNTNTIKDTRDNVIRLWFILLMIGLFYFFNFVYGK